MNVNGITEAIASGVVVRSNPMSWWVLILILLGGVGVVFLSAYVMDCRNIVSSKGGFITLVAIALVSAIGIALLITCSQSSVASSNAAAIASQYKVGNLKTTGDTSIFANRSKPVEVTFSDSQGTHKGYVVVNGNRAVLRVSNDSEYTTGSVYGYSSSSVGMVAQPDD